MNGKYYYGTGRRKSAAARVFIKPGSGQLTVNSKTLEQYFGRETSRMPASCTRWLTRPRLSAVLSHATSAISAQASSAHSRRRRRRRRWAMVTMAGVVGCATFAQRVPRKQHALVQLVRRG